MRVGGSQTGVKSWITSGLLIVFSVGVQDRSLVPVKNNLQYALMGILTYLFSSRSLEVTVLGIDCVPTSIELL